MKAQRCPWGLSCRRVSRHPSPAPIGKRSIRAAASFAAFLSCFALNAQTVIPASTPLAVRTVDALDSQTAAPGAEFRATLDEPIQVNGAVILAKGTDAVLQFVQRKPLGILNAPAELALTLAAVIVNGQRLAIETSDFRTGNSARRKLGALLNGNGRNPLAQAMQRITVPAGTRITFTLTQSLSVSPSLASTPAIPANTVPQTSVSGSTQSPESAAPVPLPASALHFEFPSTGPAFPVVQVRPDPPVEPQFQLAGLSADNLTGCGQSSDRALQCGLSLIVLLLQGKAVNLPILSAHFGPGALQSRWADRVGGAGAFRRFWNAMGGSGSYPGGGGYAAMIRIESERAFTDITFVFDQADQLANFDFQPAHEYIRTSQASVPVPVLDAQRAAAILAGMIRGDAAALQPYTGSASYAESLRGNFAATRAHYGTPVRYFISSVVEDAQHRHTCVVVVFEHAWLSMWIYFDDQRMTSFNQPNPYGPFQPPTLAPVAADSPFPRR